MDTAIARRWVQRWDTQQEHYIADREERFTVICDVVAHATAAQPCPLVLDLGCGPGSLSARVAERLPKAEIVALDNDPLLLALARGAYPEVAEFTEANLSTVDIGSLLSGRGRLDAAVSTTALHWVPEHDLVALYRRLAAVMRPGGVLVNGDHIEDDQPTISELASAVRDGRETRTGVTDNENWEQWWTAVREEPTLTALAEERARLGLGGRGNRLTVRRHVELLRDAGFAEVAPVWQVGDDVVLVAVR
ncbi:methyltransferase family protein [Herbihabitans rhizosphaerae]|uniref:Methyltransferase family protein n=1 Tax=Herbihabitans rhizosphaerae TaxID=1872711 RepID=A0A4Q7KIY5_9PSEU|nr:class I SAM-dependent methyltransferase [Herbihabitans rhizosphaerae]RZS36528.1 methyltransferase family protein [Herbihabitans rhizosphaerae]